MTLLAACLCPAALHAGEVLHSQVRRDGDHFLIHLQMQIDVPTDEVYRQLTDYDQLHRLSDVIVSSRVIDTRDHRQRVEVISEGCVLVFCRRVTQVQIATTLGQGYIRLIDDPQQSDFHSGRTLWHIAPAERGTHVTLSADLQPRFWVPPLIGTAIFKHKLLSESTTLINNLEQSAPDAP
ncbi:SRPBCC family protein [Thiohalophilus sp.]|uniref:SRPBCC family protein n=1 Tax=Thiohalophilus sp. TaxID=3028392 RepID=UPI002ACED661|nr:SRPBCC family protein [Thiohalophilus sp.]MDZ7660824.1 SRPBCC family protein [Thiohalophilus sp.]